MQARWPLRTNNEPQAVLSAFCCEFDKSVSYSARQGSVRFLLWAQVMRFVYHDKEWRPFVLISREMSSPPLALGDVPQSPQYRQGHETPTLLGPQRRDIHNMSFRQPQPRLGVRTPLHNRAWGVDLRSCTEAKAGKKPLRQLINAVQSTDYVVRPRVEAHKRPNKPTKIVLRAGLQSLGFGYRSPVIWRRREAEHCAQV
jgi:hypothetical protein